MVVSTFLLVLFPFQCNEPSFNSTTLDFSASSVTSKVISVEPVLQAFAEYPFSLVDLEYLDLVHTEPMKFSMV